MAIEELLLFHVNATYLTAEPSTIFPFFWPLVSSDSTKITLAPSNADVKVGEDTTMQCAASHDPSLDITFIWSLDDRVIDLHEESRHYERTLVRQQLG